MKKLADRVAVITGGNSGIGLSTAILFAREGARVAIMGRNPTSLESAAATIGHGAIGVISDVSVPDSIQAAYEQISGQLGKIDVLVVNAGIQIQALAADITEEQFDNLSGINFKGAFFSIQRALPYLKDGASVILTASAVNEKGFSHNTVYSATKAAVRSLARTFSQELLERKIRVNVLSPGAIDTPLFARGGASTEELQGIKTYMSTLIPAKRLGTSEEVAEGFLFLASDASRYMLGAELVMDGGVKTL